MNLRISLFALLLVASILGPGIGLAIRGYHESDKANRRERILRTVRTERERAKLLPRDNQEDVLKTLQFLVDCTPDLRSQDRERLSAELTKEIEVARVQAAIENRMARGCYESAPSRIPQACPADR